MTITLAFLIALCNMASFRASKVLVSLFAIELGANPLTIGVLVALYSLFPMLLALYAGRLSDRMGVRLPMICGSVGLALGLAVPYFLPSLTALYVSAAMLGGSYVFYNVSMQNLVGLLSRAEERTKTFSSYGLVLATGSFLGPLVAGFGIDGLGHRIAYLLLALAPLAALMILIARGREVPAPQASKQRAGEKGAMDLFRLPELRRVFIASGMVVTGVDLFQFYLPIYGHSIGLSASVIGVVLSMFAAAAFVVRSAIPYLTRRAGEETLLRWALYVGAVGYLVMPFIESAWLLGAMSFVLGLGLGVGQPLSMTLTYARSPAGRSGEALGIRMGINNFTHVVVPLAFGVLGTAFGVTPVFIASSALLAGSALAGRARRGRAAGK
jgi:MFS family permease